jgi:hypothetical protein
MAKTSPNQLFRFECEKCGIKTNNKKDYDKHCLTTKHISRTKIEQNSPILPMRCKHCQKAYKFRNSLWYHEQKCMAGVPAASEIEENPTELANLTNLVLEVVKSNAELMKQNQELQKQMMEVYKTSGTNNSYNNNKTFNMQVFLNEQCKDAMNIMDFVNSMTLELSDLEDVGEVGYVEGISKIIIRKLNELDVCKRPIHCSDFKREIMYVKDMDVWSKENSTFDKIRKAIKYVTKKNGDLLIPWIQKYPTAMNIQHPHNDIYMRIMNQAMGGRESFVESENKIIRKISKAVQINKRM